MACYLKSQQEWSIFDQTFTKRVFNIWNTFIKCWPNFLASPLRNKTILINLYSLSVRNVANSPIKPSKHWSLPAYLCEWLQAVQEHPERVSLLHVFYVSPCFPDWWLSVHPFMLFSNFGTKKVFWNCSYISKTLEANHLLSMYVIIHNFHISFSVIVTMKPF